MKRRRHYGCVVPLLILLAGATAIGWAVHRYGWGQPPESPRVVVVATTLIGIPPTVPPAAGRAYTTTSYTHTQISARISTSNPPISTPSYTHTQVSTLITVPTTVPVAPVTPGFAASGSVSTPGDGLAVSGPWSAGPFLAAGFWHVHVALGDRLPGVYGCVIYGSGAPGLIDPNADQGDFYFTATGTFTFAGHLACQTAPPGTTISWALTVSAE